MSILRVLLWPLQKRNTTRTPPAPLIYPSTSDQYQLTEPYASVNHEGKEVVFCAPNRVAAWRVQTLFSKEPDTIAWIAGFSENDIFLDIGANVGMYSVWSAMTRHVKVFAFEPESQNYALLNKNIYANKLHDRVIAYPAALSDCSGFSLLHLNEFQAGGSCHSFDEKVNYKLENRNTSISQGSFATTLDQLIADNVMPVPTHIKIDVDGLEHKIIAGARQTLTKPQLKSILIEINQNLDVHRQLVNHLEGLGFSYNQLQVDSSVRKDGPFKGVGNYVFIR